jgi:hypothetical protein
LRCITARAVQKRVKRPLLELVRREAIVQCVVEIDWASNR